MSQAAEAIAEDSRAHIAEEYASVTVSIDHLVLTLRDDGHTVVKSVFSTESAVESLMSQIDYFRQHGLLRVPGNLAMIAKAESKASIFIYTPNDSLTNVIVDAALWSELLNPSKPMGVALNPQGTVLGAHAALVTLATDMRKAAQASDRQDSLLAFVTED